MLKAKLKLTIHREFPDYLWSFQMLHISRYGARLAHFDSLMKGLPLQYSYCIHIATITADWV